MACPSSPCLLSEKPERALMLVCGSACVGDALVKTLFLVDDVLTVSFAAPIRI